MPIACAACGGRVHPWFKRFGFDYFRCQLCGTADTDPIPKERQIKAYYHRKFQRGNYLLLRHYASEYRSIYQQFADVILNRLSEENTTLRRKKILDVGCFTGEFLELMRERGASVYGTELQKEAVKIAESKFPDRIIQADIGTKHFPRLRFDIVTYLGLIEHVTDPHQLLESTVKLIKPGGLLVIQTPDCGSWLAQILGKWWPPLVPIEHIHVFSALGIKLLLASHGFTDIRIRPHIKRLPVAYVYKQFSTFGHHFGLILKPFGWFLSALPAVISLPFYGGEMIVTAKKKLN